MIVESTKIKLLQQVQLSYDQSSNECRSRTINFNMNKFKFKFKMIRWRLGQLKLNLFHSQIQIKPYLESLNLLKVLSQSYPGYKVCGVWYKKIRTKTAKHNRTMPHNLTDFLNRKLTFMVNSNTTTKGYRT